MHTFIDIWNSLGQNIIIYSPWIKLTTILCVIFYAGYRLRNIDFSDTRTIAKVCLSALVIFFTVKFIIVVTDSNFNIYEFIRTSIMPYGHWILFIILLVTFIFVLRNTELKDIKEISKVCLSIFLFFLTLQISIALITGSIYLIKNCCKISNNYVQNNSNLVKYKNKNVLYLTLISTKLNQNYKLFFNDGSRNLELLIKDTAFIDSIKNKKIELRKGDLYKIRLQSLQVKDGNQLKNTYELLKVLNIEKSN